MCHHPIQQRQPPPNHLHLHLHQSHHILEPHNYAIDKIYSIVTELIIPPFILYSEAKKSTSARTNPILPQIHRQEFPHFLRNLLQLNISFALDNRDFIFSLPLCFEGPRRSGLMSMNDVLKSLFQLIPCESEG